jgi:hypothetical protein
MTTSVKILIVAVTAALSASTAIAQKPDDAGAILREAAKAIRERNPAGAVSIDPRVGAPGHQAKRFRAPSGAVEVEHPAQTLSALRGILQGHIARTEDVLDCRGDSIKTCRLRYGVAVIALSQPTVQGDEATVSVFLTAETGEKRRPIVNGDYTVVLSRVNGRWKAMDVRVDRIS